jgi:hypothetical protein
VRIASFQGRSDLLGDVDVTVPDGLVAVVGRDDRPLREIEALLRRALVPEDEATDDGGVVAGLQGSLPRDAAEARDLATIWTGPTSLEPTDVFASLSSVLARLRGGARISQALDLLQVSSPSLDGPDDGEGGGEEERRVLRERLWKLEDAPDLLTRLEGELADLRGDHAEAAGDEEAGTMAWLRERQDAETHLQAYRDRARELKVRLSQLEASGAETPCPMCGRVLEEHFSAVVDTLREEWESVVQDGSWWKRRREQLELKPEPLQEIEVRVVRLQAATEDWAERVERARARTQELGEVRRRLGLDGLRPEGSEAALDGPGREAGHAVAAALRAVRADLEAECRAALLEAGSRTVYRLSGGRVLGLSEADPGLLRLEGVEGPLRMPAEEDRAAVVLALRLAAARELAASGGGRLGSLVVSAPFDRLDKERQLRVVDELRDLSRHAQVLLLTRGRVVDAYPEAFDAVLEILSDPDRNPGRAPSMRWLAAGVGEIEIR